MLSSRKGIIKFRLAVKTSEAMCIVNKNFTLLAFTETKSVHTLYSQMEVLNIWLDKIYYIVYVYFVSLVVILEWCFSRVFDKYS